MWSQHASHITGNLKEPEPKIMKELSTRFDITSYIFGSLFTDTACKNDPSVEIKSIENKVEEKVGKK